MDQKASVIVVGAGVVGCSVAFQLAGNRASRRSCDG
jgi:glycine/D-amino acid oxidase-like deaminating enzyme